MLVHLRQQSAQLDSHGALQVEQLLLVAWSLKVGTHGQDLQVENACLEEEAGVLELSQHLVAEGSVVEDDYDEQSVLGEFLNFGLLGQMLTSIITWAFCSKTSA